MILYRPVGLEELGLIFDGGMTGFPPRLPEQPIFYPVLNFAYASQIAREWNSTSGSCAGYVTTFAVVNEYVARFERQVVGAHEHEELWVPAEELPEFNRHIKGRIEVDAAYFGDGFAGEIPAVCLLQGADAVEQFVRLRRIADHNGMDFLCETAVQKRTVYLHYAFWRGHDFAAAGIADDRRDDLLRQIEKRWPMLKDTPFGLPRLRGRWRGGRRRHKQGAK